MGCNIPPTYENETFFGPIPQIINSYMHGHVERIIVLSISVFFLVMCLVAEMCHNRDHEGLGRVLA